MTAAGTGNVMPDNDTDDQVKQNHASLPVPTGSENNNKSNFLMMNITSLVEECAASLSFTNPMLCSGNFSLQDSMAAMELLDRKMDSCEVPASKINFTPPHSNSETEENASTGENDGHASATPNGCNSDNGKNTNDNTKIMYPRPSPTQLDDDFLPLPWDDLTLRDAVFIAVEGLVRLESMLGGASVVESIYTCLYAHASVIEDMKTRLDPPNETFTERFENLLKPSSSTPRRGTLAQHVVYATSVALVEITEIMRSIVLHGDIYEEEDFCANTYNVLIYSNHEKESTMSQLTHTLMLAREMQEVMDSTEGRALLHILGFLTDLLNVSSNVARVAGSRVVCVMAEIKTVITQSALPNLRELRALFEKLLDTETDHDLHILQRTFDPFVSRPLFGNSPVRKVVFLEPQKSLDVLSTIVAEIDWALCDIVLKGKTLGRIRRFLDRISKSSINILTRSLIVLNLYFDEKLLGQFSLLKLIMKHAQEMAAAPADLFESKHGQIFLNRLAKPMYDTLKIRLLNRNRQRPFMEAVIFPDWSQLQQEAHIVDVHYRREKGLDNKSPPFVSHYVLSNLVDLMDLHVSIGVELSLYQSHEDLSVVFWYRDFLLSALLNNLSAMQKTKLSGQKGPAQQGDPSGKSNKSKKKNHGKRERNGSSGSAQQSGLEELEYEYDMMVLECKRSLCRGLVRFIAALHQGELLEKNHFHFTRSEKVFQKRFEVFANIQQPPPLTYEDFLQGSDFGKVSQCDLLLSTSECFRSSKATVGKIIAFLPSLDPAFTPMTKEELNQIAKVCVGNSVYILKMKQLVDEHDEGKAPSVDFAFDSNSEFCTIKLV